MSWRRLSTLIGIVVAGTMAVGAAEPGGDAAEIAELKKQMAEQAAIIEALQSRLEEVEARQTATDEVVEEQAAAAASAKPSVTSEFPMELYGYIKLDASYDSRGVSNGNYIRWVDPADSGRHDDQFSVTARQTRLGLRIKGPSLNGADTEGKVEVDFYGSGGENTPELRMRHAYITIDYPARDLQFLLGQTWDLMSPLVPRTLSFTNLWWTGNIGFRRPQARVTKGFAIGDTGRLELALAATRNVGDPNLFAFGEDTGSDAGFPAIQGRVAYSFDGWAGRTTTLGLSGHYGEEEFDFPGFFGGRNDQDVKSWSASLDAEIPIGEYLLFKAEAFTGANLDAYVGGIGQGVVVVPFEDGRFAFAQEVRSHGGWVNLHIVPPGKWRFSVGAGFEDPDDSDLRIGARSRNIGMFANADYFLRKNIMLSAELARWETDYLNRPDVAATRLQTAVRFDF